LRSFKIKRRSLMGPQLEGIRRRLFCFIVVVYKDNISHGEERAGIYGGYF
jgi:hypothetical protein